MGAYPLPPYSAKRICRCLRSHHAPHQLRTHRQRGTPGGWGYTLGATPWVLVVVDACIAATGGHADGIAFELDTCLERLLGHCTDPLEPSKLEDALAAIDTAFALGGWPALIPFAALSPKGLGSFPYTLSFQRLHP